MSDSDKPLVWLHGEVKSPPFSRAARVEVGFLLRNVQQGVSIPFPLSRPMPRIGSTCHELRIVDIDKTWRIIYAIHTEAILILEVFQKVTRQTPDRVMSICRKRLRSVNEAERKAKHG
jgi:phage-related protein